MRLLIIVLDSLLLLLVVALGFLSLSKSFGLGQLAHSIELTLGSDKRLHFIAGLVITLLLFRLLRRVLDFNFSKALTLSPFIAITVLLVDEFSQLLIPSRYFSADDIGAGFFGIISTLLMLVFYQYVLARPSKTLLPKIS
ncbi:MAG: hypothetical protein GY951_12850 [Psychromonas sp.]|nr:hypothetical protein [Psychromonas sp.]